MRRHLWLVPLLGLFAACPPPQSSSRRSRSVLDDLRDDDGDDADRDRDQDRNPNQGDDDSTVVVNYNQLTDAMVEPNESGIPRQNVDNLRRILCEGRDAQTMIFYRLIVATHWHYYWLCSDTQARRASSSYGARHIRRWLKNFKRQAATMSAGCRMGAAVLKGNHESGVRATAYCDGRLVLIFPDGGKTTKSFSSQGYGGGGGGGVPTAGTAENCPPCPATRSGGGYAGGDCPPPKVCPVCAVCQACPPPKPCDCKPEVVKMGKKFWWDGVNKACGRYCKMIYTECRRINPKTAMCSMLQEHCEKHCAKP